MDEAGVANVQELQHSYERCLANEELMELKQQISAVEIIKTLQLITSMLWKEI
jgi:hypothetical protein